MAKFLEKFLGTKSNRDIKAILPIQKKILEAGDYISKLTNDELRAKTIAFKNTIAEKFKGLEKNEKLLSELINFCKNKSYSGKEWGTWGQEILKILILRLLILVNLKIFVII